VLLLGYLAFGAGYYLAYASVRGHGGLWRPWRASWRETKRDPSTSLRDPNRIANPLRSRDDRKKQVLARGRQRFAPAGMAAKGNSRSDAVEVEAKEEKLRYTRFLEASVDYTAKSFEDFVANPLAVIRR
jgi:hypothetical protein